MNIGRPRLVVAVLSFALVGVGCSGSAATMTPTDGAASAPATSSIPSVGPSAAVSGCDLNQAATIEMWSIQNTEPTKSTIDGIVKAFTDAHPQVKVNVTAQADTVLVPKLDTAIQAGNPPDIFFTWGGGVLAQQASTGMVKDITADVADWISGINPAAAAVDQVDGKQYGIPYDYGMVGLWYNKELFTKAGITTPPTTWEELLADVAKLKAAGITPIAVGEGEQWPGMFWYAYIALRLIGKAGLDKAAADGSFDSPGFVQAGTVLKQLVDLEPFQKGFLAAPSAGAGGSASAMANGEAAMELMGHWAPNQQAEVASNKVGLGDNLGWFPFPAIDGGVGQSTDAFGGVNGFAVGKDAPCAAVELLKFMSTVDNAKALGSKGGLIPPVVGAESSVTSAALQPVIAALSKATAFQVYLDQAYAPAVGSAINDQVQGIMAGKTSPEDAAKAIAAAAKGS